MEKRVIKSIILFLTSLVAIFVMVVSLVRCDDIIEDDLSSDVVQLVSPSDSVKTTVVAQTFIWQAVKGATGYRLEIATPSFDRAEQMVVYMELDTIVYKCTLFPGNFQWRVVALNSSSSSKFATRSLLITSTDDISGQIIVAVNPPGDYNTSESKNQFAWQDLYSADSYEVLIKNSSSGNILFPNLTTTYDTITKTIPEGRYQWSVRGYNKKTDTYSRYSQTNILTVDKTAPEVPVLKSPVRWSSQASRDVVFQWNKPADNLTSVSDSLLVTSDSTSWVHPVVAIKTSIDKSSYSFSFSTSGKYYWKVRSIDQAGNLGAYSAYYSFTIQ